MPRKRPSISTTGSTSKKRKPSNLRNSFAPESEMVGSPLRYSRSPSVDSSVAGPSSIANGIGGKRRKRKDGDERSMTGASMRGGKAGSTTGASNVNAEGAEEDDDDDEEEIEGEGMDAVLEGGKMDEAKEKQEMEHRRYAPFPISNHPHPQPIFNVSFILTNSLPASSWKP